MRTLLTLLFIGILCPCVCAQPTEAQIRNAITTTDYDSVKIRAYKDLLLQKLDDPPRRRELMDTVTLYRDIVGTDFAQAIWYSARTEIAFADEDVEQAREIYRESIEDFKQRGNNLRVADQSYLLSITYRNEADYASIFAITLEGLKYALKTNRLDMIGKMYNSMGITQRRMGDPDAAIRYFRLAAVAQRKNNDYRRLFSPVVNLANLYGDKEMIDSSLYYYQVADTIANRQEPPNLVQIGYIKNNLSSLYERREDFPEALIAARAAYAIFDKQEDARGEKSYAASNIANALYKLERYEESLPYLQEWLAFSDKESEDLQNRKKGIWQLARIYAATGRTDSLAARYEEVLQLTDTIMAQNQTAALLDMEGKYQNDVKQAEIDRLALEAQLDQERIKQQRWLIYGGLMLFGLLGSFLYFLLQQRQHIRAQNVTIRATLGEKDTLLKEIHHRVKNNLQMVSSLLSLQGEFIEDSAALEAIEMGQQRVRSMAIIHQRLYLRDEVSTTVSAREYLDQLIQELIGALNVKGTQLRLEQDLEDISLDIDRLIPLGLIANEVITNAMKHAFTGRTRGLLTVSLRNIGSEIELRIADDGTGQEADFAGKPDSFGNLLVRIFAEQLDGTLTVDGENGTSVSLRFRG